MGRRKNGQYLFYIAAIIVCILIYLRYSVSTEGFNAIEDTLSEIPEFIPHKTYNEERVVSGVPLVIYQSWHINKVPPKMKESIYKLIEMNPEFDYKLFSDATSVKYIQDNFDEGVVNAFNALKPGAFKSDLWRYCILYKEGGVYLDIKLHTIKPLLPVIRDNPTIYVKDLKGSCIGEDVGLYNAFMVSPPGNVIFKYCIDDIVNSAKFKLYKDTFLSVTGPCLLGDIVYKNISLDYIKQLKFRLFWYGNMPENDVEIKYNGDSIIKSYIGYRMEQSKYLTVQKTKHYSTLWNDRDIYN